MHLSTKALFSWLPEVQENASQTLFRVRVDGRVGPRGVANVIASGWVGLMPAGMVTREHLTYKDADWTEPLVFTAARMKTLPSISHLIDTPMMKLKGADGFTLMEICARNGTLFDLPQKFRGKMPIRLLRVAAQTGTLWMAPYAHVAFLNYADRDGRTPYHYAAMRAGGGTRASHWEPTVWNRQDAAGETPLHMYLRRLKAFTGELRAKLVQRLHDFGAMDPKVNWYAENGLGDTPARMASRMNLDVGRPPDDPSGKGSFFPNSAEHAEQARGFWHDDRLRVAFGCLSAGLTVPECVRREEGQPNRLTGIGGRREVHFSALGGKAPEGKGLFSRDHFGEIPLHHYLQSSIPKNINCTGDYRYHHEGWLMQNNIGVDPVDVALAVKRPDLIPFAIHAKIHRNRTLSLADHIPAAEIANAHDIFKHEPELRKWFPEPKPTTVAKDSGPQI